MGLNIGSGEICTVSCDDPLAIGCLSQTRSCKGQKETADFALSKGWFKNESSGLWTCHYCYQFSMANFHGSTAARVSLRWDLLLIPTRQKLLERVLTTTTFNTRNIMQQANSQLRQIFLNMRGSLSREIDRLIAILASDEKIENL
jgi:hypothetical protein